jgi:hypothetical protein
VQPGMKLTAGVCLIRPAGPAAAPRGADGASDREDLQYGYATAAQSRKGRAGRRDAQPTPTIAP